MELYLHIPFCVRKCGYCDFLSFPSDEETRGQYLEALTEELRLVSAAHQRRPHLAAHQRRPRSAERQRRPDSAAPDRKMSLAAGHESSRRIDTIFIGGGTPSVLTARQIVTVMERIFGLFDVAPDAEITIEANPGTIDFDKLKAYRQAGINRLSIGCQSMHDGELACMGRIHDRATFLRSYELARSAGFSNISFDLISGLPGQTAAAWETSLRLAAALAPEHISAYSLILEEGTPFYEQRQTLDLPDEEEERLMYECTAEVLLQYGYGQYELSNYAKPGFACRHNTGYWTGVPYLGVGLGAASCCEAAADCGQAAEMIRFTDCRDLRTYLSLCGNGRIEAKIEELKADDPDTAWKCFLEDPLHTEQERLSGLDLQAEYMILGLRMTRGVSETGFRARFGKELRAEYGDLIEKYRAHGLLALERGRLFLTKRGQSLANVVMAEFL
ncbi:MAG: radical SAM family heme chaperone HemW [Eubacterium sp.]|nr:radical SAM family heme chaperone HemW [Eubacterium sp.]